MVTLLKNKNEQKWRERMNEWSEVNRTHTEKNLELERKWIFIVLVLFFYFLAK